MGKKRRNRKKRKEKPMDEKREYNEDDFKFEVDEYEFNDEEWWRKFIEDGETSEDVQTVQRWLKERDTTIYKGPVYKRKPWCEELKPPTVKIPLSEYCKIAELCRKSGSYEIGWFGTLYVEDYGVRVGEIFLPDQEVGYATVDITGLEGLAMDLISQNRVEEAGRLWFWGHCHPSKNTNPSCTDEKEYDELCESCPTMLMGIFSDDASTAYFRLRHHGMDIRMNWEIDALEHGENYTIVHNHFSDFKEKVSFKAQPHYLSGYSGYIGGVGVLPSTERVTSFGEWRDIDDDDDVPAYKRWYGLTDDEEE